MADKISIADFTGGLNTAEPTAIADNQLSVARNVSYDNQGILGVRRGVKNFGTEIVAADGISSIYFTKFTDGTRILLCAEGTQMYKYNEGTSNWDSIKAGLTNGLDYSFVTYKNVIYAANGTDNVVGYANFAKLTGGSGATSIIAGWTAIADGSFNVTVNGATQSATALDFTSATTMIEVAEIIEGGLTGVSVAWITDHFELTVNTGALTDTITVLSAQGGGTDISGAGGTPFMDAETGRGTVSSGALVAAELPNIPKGKYLALENDVAYIAGVSTDPSTVFYTNANPGSLTTDGFQNDEPVNQDEGIITGLAMFGPLLVVGKDRGVYLVNVFASPVSIDPLDFDGDVQSHRSMVNVENDLLFMSSRGVYSLAQRQGTTASYRAFAWSQSIDREIKRIGDLTSTSAFYFPKTNNVYFAVDSGEVNRNDKMFVYSSLVSQPGARKFVWTEYVNINANDFTHYEDSDGEIHLLVANAFGGQVLEMEEPNQHTDAGQEISAIMRTKTFDFGLPEAYKNFQQVNLSGFITDQEEVTFKLFTDGVETSKTFTGENFAVGDDADDFPLGEEDLGLDPVGSGPISIDGLDYYPFTQRRSYYKYGLRLTVQIETNSVNSALKITKLTIPVEALDDSVFPNDFITT